MINIRKIIVAAGAVILGHAAAAANPVGAANVALPNGDAATLVGFASADDEEGLTATVTRENEGYPDPQEGRCALVTGPFLDVRGNVVGYHTFNVCR
ncbi:MAG: hypothetical protein WDN46_23645 [Methylocella sp.]